LIRGIGNIAISAIVVPILLLTWPAVAVGQEVPQEECVNVSAERIAGIGGWFVHNETGLSMRYWSSEAAGIELDFLASPSGGRLRFLGKALNKVIDTCYIDGYMAGGVEIPIGGTIDWQRLDISGGVGWSLPPISQLAVSLEIGLSVNHYYHCWWNWHKHCGWDWSSETFTAMGFHYYF